jgi:nucleoside-diphosphate-sugar epimerase
MPTLLALGFGYSAAAVAASLKEDGWTVIGTARTLQGVAAIEALGHQAILFDGEAPSPALADALGEATHLLHSAPPDERGDPLLIHHESELNDGALRWAGYLSTIGVYGDRQGAWVDETDEAAPTSPRSKERADAERAWQAAAERHGLVLGIFRLAGIYGPGRNTLERLIAGTEKRIDKPEQVFNRIHRDDIAATVLASIELGEDGGGIFNVTDDEPAPPQDIVAYGASLLGIEPPPLIPWEKADLTPMGRSFYLETKRVRNAKIKDVLGVTLTYPTYREGLQALAAEIRASGRWDRS